MLVFQAYEAIQSLSGASLLMQELAQHLTSSGHQVVVLTTHNGTTTVQQTTDEGFQLYRLPGKVNFQRKSLTWSRRGNFRHVDELVRKYKPDVIHVHDFGFVSNHLVRSAGKHNIPVIAHHHFSREFVERSIPAFLKAFPGGKTAAWTLAKYIVRKMYNRCAEVISPTEVARLQILDWGITSPVTVIPNGVDLERFFPTTEPSVPDMPTPSDFWARPVVVYAGRIDFDKNCETLVRAIPQVLKNCDASFLFLGDGEDRPRLQKLPEAVERSNRIYWAGYIPHESAVFPALLQKSSICWSASPIEVQSLALLEAMACGLPVIMSEDSALPDLVRDGESGFLVATFDVDTYASRCRELLKSSALMEHFRSEGLKVAEAHSIQLTWERILSSYYKHVQGSALADLQGAAVGDTES